MDTATNEGVTKSTKRRKSIFTENNISTDASGGENLGFRHLKQHKNLLKLETVNMTTPGSITPINQIVNLQDSDIKELIAFIDQYLHVFLERVGSKDRLIGVNLSSKWPTHDNRVIQIEGLIELDLLRNGLQSAVAIQPQIKTPAHSNLNSMFAQSSLPKLGAQVADDQTSSTKSGEKSSSTLPPTMLNFNYQIVIGLNPDYFKLEQPSSDLNLYKIRLTRKPMHWSPSELSQLTLDMSNSNRQSYGQKKKSTLYLNSKALLDRLFLQLSASLKLEWPSRQKHQINPHIHKIQIVGEDPTLDLNELAVSNINVRRRSSLLNRRSPLGGAGEIKEDDMMRTCELENNRFRIEFKWKGTKPHFRNLNVILVISVVVDLKHVWNLDGPILDVLNGLKISSNDWNSLYEWLGPKLNPSLARLYLSPVSFVHMWSLDTRLVKLNLLKLLLVYDSLKSSTLDKSLTIDELLKTGNNSNSISQAASLQSGLDEIARLNNHPSNFLSYFRLLQIIFSQFLEKWTPFLQKTTTTQPHIQDMDSEDLLINVALTEIKSSSNWSNEHLFERLWSSLIKLRCQLGVEQVVPDVFGLVRNQVPLAYAFSEKNAINLLSLFEITMRKLIKNVITDETDGTIGSLELTKKQADEVLPIEIRLNDELILDECTSSKLVNAAHSSIYTITTNTSDP